MRYSERKRVAEVENRVQREAWGVIVGENEVQQEKRGCRSRK